MKAYNFHLSHGLSVMFTNQGKFLCYDPNEHDKTAKKAWWKHSEKRIREWWADQLVAKRLINVTKGGSHV